MAMAMMRSSLSPEIGDFKKNVKEHVVVDTLSPLAVIQEVSSWVVRNISFQFEVRHQHLHGERESERSETRFKCH